MSLNEQLRQGLLAFKKSQFEQAKRHFQSVLHSVPNHIIALHYLGKIFISQSQYKQALDSLLQALEYDPDNPDILFDMAVIYQNNRQVLQAEMAYFKITMLRPQHFESYYNLGLLAHSQQNLGQAQLYFEKAIKINPSSDKSFNSLGSVLQIQGKSKEAIEYFKEAIKLNPDYCEAHNNLGNTLQSLKKIDQAILHYHQALRIKPDYCEAYNNLGNAYKALGQLDKAEQNYQQSIQIQPTASALNNLGNALQARGQISLSLKYFYQALEMNHLSPLDKIWSNFLFTLEYSAPLSPQKKFNYYQKWGQAVEKILKPYHHTIKKDSKVLKIGYISPDLKEHAAAFFLEAFIKNHNPQAFIVYVYADVSREDHYTENFKAMVAHWYNCSGLSDVQLAQLVYSHHIDILIDPGMGHTAKNRLLTYALKPAPLQITTYPTTTGLTRIDYRITDRFLDPEDEREASTEKLAYLPHSVSCYSPPEEAPEVNDLPALKQEVFTFGCFNNLSKLNSEVIALWAKILQEVPDSILVLKNASFRSPTVKNDILKQFESFDISSQRLHFLSYSDNLVQHLKTYNTIDLALDPFPYNGFTTTCEALWMGVPVLTLASFNHFGRASLGYLTLIGLSEFIASDKKQYCLIAQTITNKREHLNNIRQTLRKNMLHSPLCNQKLFIQSLESSLKTLWNHQQIVSDDTNEALMIKGQKALEREGYSNALNIFLNINQTGPYNPKIYEKLAFIHFQLNQPAQAYQYYQKLIQLEPDNSGHLMNLAQILRLFCQYDLAIQTYQKALQLEPANFQILVEIGDTYQLLQAWEEAETAYKKALQVKPDTSKVLYKLGLLYQTHQNYQLAMNCFTRSLALNDAQAESHYGMGFCLIQIGLNQKSFESFYRSLNIVQEHAQSRLWSHILFALTYDPNCKPEELSKYSQSWGHVVTKEVVPFTTYTNPLQAERRLKIAYISPDFRDHSAAFFLEAFFRNRNRNDFEVIGLSDVKTEDKLTHHFQKTCDQWINIQSLSNEQVAQLIYTHQIDILIDPGMGHSDGNRLPVFAYKPAPIQMTTYPMSTGLSQIDYRIALSKQEDETLSSETLIDLGEFLSMCYIPPDETEIAYYPSCSLTFGSFNELRKINDEVIKVWSSILNQLPESKLVLKNKSFNNTEAQTNVLQQFQKYGIVAERIELLAFMPKRMEHFQLYNRIDIALDPFPFNGMTTTCEALWMGVPVITLTHPQPFGQAATAFIKCLDLDDCIATTQEQYIELAVSLAKDSKRLQNIKTSLRSLMERSPICDQKGFIQIIEKTYRQLWQKWCQHQSPSSNLLLSQGVQFHRQGQLEKALEYYQKILKNQPDHSEALHLSGLAADQMGNSHEAINLLQQALQQEPDNTIFLNNLGHSLRKKGHLVEAKDAYQKAVELQPEQADSRLNLANILQSTGDYKQALKQYQIVIEKDPKSSLAHNNLGLLYLKQNQTKAALKHFQLSINLSPNHIDAHLNLGKTHQILQDYNMALKEFENAYQLAPQRFDVHNHLGSFWQSQNQFNRALNYYHKALEINPQDLLSLYNSALIYQEQDSFKQAINYYQKILQLTPQHHEAQMNAGYCYQHIGQLETALKHYQAVLQHAPNHYQTLYNTGLLYQTQHQWDLAQEHYEKALKVRPDFAKAQYNYCLVLFKKGLFTPAIQALHQAFKLVKRQRLMDTHCHLLFALLYDPNQSQSQLFKEYQIWGQRLEEQIKLQFLHLPEEHPIIKIGYLSPDFRNHSAAFFLKAHFEQPNRERFEIFAYADVKKPDEYTQYFKNQADHWRNVSSLKDQELAALIYQDKIDILIDQGTGHTEGNRLGVFAHKPAPIQLTSYPTTTGLSRIDYRISDAHIDSPDLIKYNTEKVLIMPHSTMCYSPPEDAPAIHKKIVHNKITFCSFNNLSKINDNVIQIWSEILKQLPQSQLLMKSSNRESPSAIRYYKQCFETHGIAPNRIIFLDYAPSRNEHLKAYNQVDIALDSFPFNGMTTTCEALWMGVPVITLATQHHLSRVSKGFLSLINLQPFIAHTPQQYIEKAVQLAKSPDLRTFYPQQLRSIMSGSPLCDTQKYIKTLEKYYIKIWSQWKQSADKKVRILHQAQELHQSGEFAQAETLYEEILLNAPKNPELLHILGVICHQKKNYSKATQYLREAIQQKRDDPVFFYHLGTNLMSSGQLPEAISNFKMALKLKPDYIKSHYSLGLAFQQAKLTKEAEYHYRQAIKLDPRNEKANLNLGNLLQSYHHWSTAISHYEIVLSQNPDHFEANYNLGRALLEMNQLDRADKHFQRALKSNPTHSKVWHNIGLMYFKKGALPESIKAYKQALNDNRESSETLYNLGLSYQKQGDMSQALLQFKKALAIAQENKFTPIQPYLLFALQYDEQLSPESIFQYHKLWGQQLEHSITPFTHQNRSKLPDRKLKVAYLSPDFRNHSAIFFMEAFFTAYNRDIFEIYIYADLKYRDQITQYFENLTEHWHDISALNSQQIAQAIYQDKIDILVDPGAGHTSLNLDVFAYQPAPIAITQYPTSTGLNRMDYRLTDLQLDPPPHASHLNTEHLLYLRCFLCYHPPDYAPDINSLPAEDNGFITFASFNSFAKINGKTIELWSHILQQLPASQLVLKSSSRVDQSAQLLLTKQFAQYGITSQRLIFLPFAKDNKAHLKHYQSVDICLDTHPYNGMTTTCESLWMGVPVLTLMGSGHFSRASSSLLKTIELNDWIASTPEQYIEKAIQLSKNIQELKNLRQTLRHKMKHSPLCKTRQYMNQVEQLYQEVWRNWCEGKIEDLSAT